MGSGKAAVRKDPAPASAAGRRLFMESLPTPHHTTKRRSAPPLPPSSSSKRPRPLPRYLYAPGRHLDSDRLLTPHTPYCLVEVYIPGDHLTTSHSPLIQRYLWGSDRYTDDSDLVAVLAHSGKFVLPATRGGVDYVRVQVRLSKVTPGLSFPSVERNGITSRAWGDAYQSAVLQVEEVDEVRMEDSYCAVRRPGVLAEVLSVPGLDTSGKQKQRAGNIKVSYDLCNEPCVSFNLSDVFRLDGKIIDRLVEGEVLYVENDTDRYEIANLDKGIRFGKVNADVLDRIRLSGIGLDASAIEPPCSFPMSNDDLQVIAKDLAWNQLYWSGEGVTINGKHYKLTKLLFREINH